MLPVGVHVGAETVIGHFPDPRIVRFGGADGTLVKGCPVGPMQAFTKRAFDIALSLTAIVLLSPLFALLALLIKLDSKGPVFFRQRRRGYNQQEFVLEIPHHMTALDDGDVIAQATRADARITRVGRWLRRLKYDRNSSMYCSERCRW